MITMHEGLTQFEKELPSIQEWLDITDWHTGGSTTINGEGNDLDIIILVGRDIEAIEDIELHAEGWALLGEESYQSCGMFKSYRKGDLNLIVTDDELYYENWKIARNVCIWLARRHGLRDRSTRVMVHHIVCDLGTDTTYREGELKLEGH